eukprot:gene6652-2736_t
MRKVKVMWLRDEEGHVVYATKAAVRKALTLVDPASKGKKRLIPKQGAFTVADEEALERALVKDIGLNPDEDDEWGGVVLDFWGGCLSSDKFSEPDLLNQPYGCASSRTPSRTAVLLLALQPYGCASHRTPAVSDQYLPDNQSALLCFAMPAKKKKTKKQHQTQQKPDGNDIEGTTQWTQFAVDMKSLQDYTGQVLYRMRVVHQTHLAATILFGTEEDIKQDPDLAKSLEDGLAVLNKARATGKS